MPLWKTTIAYDGTGFHGWQIQPNLPSVQGVLSEAIRLISGEEVLPQGSGRTDAGVHALAQVASFELVTAIPASNLQRALNHHLPASVRVLSAVLAPDGFHARHSALRKTYEYRIFPRRPPLHDTARPNALPRETRICSPMLAPYVWDTGLHLSLPALDRATRHVVGTHDFTSFASTTTPEAVPYVPRRVMPDYPTAPPTNRRTIFDAVWRVSPHESVELLIFRVTGSGFLHKMIRNLVGTVTQAGAGRLDPDAIPGILRACQRSAAGPTAPAQGLFLAEVIY